MSPRLTRALSFTPITVIIQTVALLILAFAPSSMSNKDASQYWNIPLLTRSNFPRWEIQVISFLTGAADHVCVIEPCLNTAGAYIDPARPTDAAKQARWDASECEALGVIMCTVSNLHLEVIHHHRKSRQPIYMLWTKI